MMSVPKRILPWLGLVALALAALLLPGPVAGSASNSSQASSQRDPRQLFVEVYRCSTCHGVGSAGIEARTRSDRILARDLSGYRPKPGFDVVSYLRKRSRVDGEVHKIAFPGTDEEAKAILDWLGSLETVRSSS